MADPKRLKPRAKELDDCDWWYFTNYCRAHRDKDDVILILHKKIPDNPEKCVILTPHDLFDNTHLFKELGRFHVRNWELQEGTGRFVMDAFRGKFKDKRILDKDGKPTHWFRISNTFDELYGPYEG